LSKLILIAGIPASGKTRYGLHISNRLNLIFFSKDAFKEKLHDVLKWDNAVRENSKFYGMAAYSVFFHAVECAMRTGAPLAIESNFVPECEETLNVFASRYCYEALTVLFDADSKILHRRFIERDLTGERHRGLISGGLKHDDFSPENFEKSCAPMRDFIIGERIVVDTTDFAKVDYGEIDEKVIGFLNR